MKINEFVGFLERNLPRGRRVCAVGKPGVGKTFAFMEAGQRLAWDLIVISAPLEDPSTIRGYPRAAGEVATHCLFDGMARAFGAERDALLLFDDLGMAREATLQAIVRFWQTQEIDGRRLPDCVRIAAATNDVGQGSGVYGMIEPLKTRFHTIVEVETAVDDLASYGLAHGWPTDLIAFLRNCPEAIHDWKPSKTMHVDGASPRGWEYVAEWINLGEEDPEVIGGCVGRGRAGQYLAFRSLINQLPDIDQVLLDPEGAPVPDQPDARFLVSCALSGRMSSSNFGQCVKYLQRLPGMFRAFSIRDAFRAEAHRRQTKLLTKDHKPISSSRDFSAWVLSADGKEIMAAASLD